jgi:hypothetical protein
MKRMQGAFSFVWTLQEGSGEDGVGGISISSVVSRVSTTIKSSTSFSPGVVGSSSTEVDLFLFFPLPLAFVAELYEKKEMMRKISKIAGPLFESNRDEQYKANSSDFPY